jgi:ribulose-phosphate 3-epimerase
MCADPLNMYEDLAELENSIDLWHIDIMDGVYVPNIAMNFDTVKAIKKVFGIPIDMHLMVSKPGLYIDLAASSGVDYLSFHIETDPFLIRTCKKIRDLGMKPGLAINPTSSIERVPYILEYLEYLLVMTVEPGFAGQNFIDNSLEKITTLKSMITRINPGVEIMVDGNMNPYNAARVLEAGADIVVGGTSSIFMKTGTLVTNLQAFRDSTSQIRSELSS